MRYAIILSRQRSGTTSFRLALGTQADVQDWGEIFHHIRGPHDDSDYERFHVHPEANFFCYRQELFRRFPEMSFPSVQNQLTIWRRYLMHVEFLAPRVLHLFDVKYNTAHHIDQIYHSQFEKPLLLTALEQNSVPIIHLERLDPLSQALSLIRAQHTGNWHRPVATEPCSNESDLDIDPTIVYWTMERARGETERFKSYLKTNRNVLNLEYETLYSDEGTFNPSVLITALQFLGIESASIPSLTPPLKKLNRSALNGIANREAILNYLEKTHYAALVARQRSIDENH